MSETKAENKKLDKCLFILSEKGKWGIQNHLKPLKPIYNGVGWFIEEKYRGEAEQICQQANMRLREWPLNGETFEQLKRRNKSDFLQVKSIEKKLLIDGLKATLGIHDLDTDSLKHGEHRENLEKLPEGKELLENINEHEKLQEQIKIIEEEEKIANISVQSNIPPIITIGDRIKSHNEMISQYRGKKYLGLTVETISEFNEKLKGLRKLILLAAAPNVGKTALTIQLAQEMLSLENDACLVYVSLEMSSDEIFTRMILCLSGLDFDTYVLGKEQVESENGTQHLFSKEDLRKIEEATKKLEQIGDRLQIIDSSICHVVNADGIINHIEKLKKETGCNRTIVIIDYLQVWPTPQGVRFTSDIEADKWRIGEIKKIRDSINKVNQDPVIVISESRKPSATEDTWGGDLSDVMGSARGTYTPDVVLLLTALQPTQLDKLWKKMKMPEITFNDIGNEIENEKDPSNIKGFLAHHGIAICSLKMAKGRDGMNKFNILLSFHFRKNKFEPINWLDIRGIAMGWKDNKR